jgi:hypothetical protein
VGGRARGKRLAVIVSSVSVQLEGHRGQSLWWLLLFCCCALGASWPAAYGPLPSPPGPLEQHLSSALAST